MQNIQVKVHTELPSGKWSELWSGVVIRRLVSMVFSHAARKIAEDSLEDPFIAVRISTEVIASPKSDIISSEAELLEELNANW